MTTPTTPSQSESWRTHLIDDDAAIADLLQRTRRIAVLGIKTANDTGQPAYYVPQYAQAAGYEIVPVPVYYPEVIEILGQLPAGDSQRRRGGATREGGHRCDPGPVSARGAEARGAVTKGLGSATT